MKQAPIELQQKNHIVWLDVVRLIAMFTVVCCHSPIRSISIQAQPPILMK